MKILIELDQAEVKGIKQYLKETDGRTPTKKDIEIFIRSYVEAINHPGEAVSDYINQHREQ